MERGLNWLEQREEEIIDFARRLVQTPSLSGEEGEVAQIVEEELLHLGYDVKRDFFGSLLARRGREEGRKILFDGHLDHVEPGDTSKWRYPPYAAEMVEGNLYGRGSADMKCSLAAMIYGCATPQIQGEVILSLVVHEETNEGFATKNLMQEYDLKPEVCVLGEPTNLSLAIGQRGRAVFRITTRGKTSHASMPDLGVNAVYRMMPIIQSISYLNENLTSDPILGKGSVVVTEISSSPGGGPIVPDRCDILVDRRTVRGESLELITRELERATGGASVELITDRFLCYTGEEAEVTQYFPGWVMDMDHRVVKKAREALSEALGEHPEIIVWRFSTDGVATAGELYLPTIGFGCGDPSLAHQPNEHVKIDDIISSAKGYCALALSMTED